MKARLPLLSACLVLSGCAAEYEWRGLPDVDGVQGWLLAPSAQPAQWFSDQGISVSRFEQGRLWALPVPPETLATPTPPQLGTGGLVAVQANFTLEDGDWRVADPSPVRVPLVPGLCGEQCVLYEPCPDCVSGLGNQTCGACDPQAPEPASLPSKECPPGWQGTEYPDGHFGCMPTEAAGLRVACPEEQRWSWDEQRCVAIAPCAMPEVEPGEDATYIDATAAVDGDGSQAFPFQQIPTQVAANQTIVLAPGSYVGPLRLSEPGVRLVGHGVCSVLTGSAGVDVLSVLGGSAEVEHLRIESAGTGIALLVSVDAQLDLHDALLTGSDRVLDSDGVVEIQRARFVRGDGCVAEFCLPEQAAVHLRGGGRLSNVDVEGPNAIWSQFAGVTVRQSRLIPSPEGFGFLGSGPGNFLVESTTSFGGVAGMSFQADGNMQVNLTDVQIATRTSTLGSLTQGVAVVGQDQSLTQVDVLRTSIESSGHGIDLNYGILTASQLRVRAQGRGIEAAENERVHRVSVSDSWLDAEAEVIAGAGSDVFVGNSWVRTCTDCDSKVRVFIALNRPFDFTPDTLEVRTVHVVAGNRAVANSFFAMELYDLTAVSQRTRALDSRSIDGARWSLRGLSNLLEVSERLNVSDIAIQADEPLAAICIEAGAEVIIDRFSVEGPEGLVPIAVDPAEPGFPNQVERWRLSHGLVPAPPLILASEDRCRTLQPLEVSPVVDRVRFR